jgi:hypothetical protein
MEMCVRVLMIAWRTWHARNEVTHDKPLPSIEGSRRFICSYIKTLENIIGLSSEAGMIPRRGDGSIIFSGYRALRFCSSALDSELSGCMEGITMAPDSSEEKIIVEMDYMQLVSMSNNSERDSSCFGHMVAD